MGAVKKVHGIAWESGVIANAKWAGVRLCDVLQHAGVQMTGSAHVLFASYVTLCQDDNYYGASIPLAKAQNCDEDVLLAFEVRQKQSIILEINKNIIQLDERRAAFCRPWWATSASNTRISWSTMGQMGRYDHRLCR
jgi:hypothetical protein